MFFATLFNAYIHTILEMKDCLIQRSLLLPDTEEEINKIDVVYSDIGSPFNIIYMCIRSLPLKMASQIPNDA